MNSETPPSSDPLFGNNVSDLMREAMDPATRIPTGDPRYWQPPTPEDLQARLGGAYLVQAFLARGGMGAVYRGIQASLERPVAIKILPPQLRDADPSFAQRFKQEAKAMAQLNHPSIVSVYDFGEMPDGTLYFIMEFVDGIDVAQMVTRQGRLSSSHAMAITAHVCDALQYAHEHGVVHRDIKPANIMVGNDGRVKVADFGLAKSSRVTQSSLTMTGHVMGTPHFLAPEALTLGSSVDHRADIYAVGVMLYQMLTGRLPKGIFEMPSLLVPGLDPRYDAIITAAMREDRSVRYQAILDMRRALDAILTKPVAKSQAAPQQPAAAPAQAAAPKPQPGQHYYRPPQAAAPTPVAKTKSSGGLWALAAVIALVLGGAAWVILGGRTQTSASTTPEATVSSNLVDTILFPKCSFEQATIAEAIEYFTLTSRDLDPAKKGITIQAPESVRNLPVRLTMHCRDRTLSELLDYVAHLARLDVTYRGGEVSLALSASMKPPFPKGSPTASQQRFSQAILPRMQFDKANLGKVAEYLRLRSRELSQDDLNVLIDPALDEAKPQISLNLVRVAIPDALEYIAALSGAEVVYVQNAFYLQPASQAPVKLPVGSLPDLGAVGKLTLVSMPMKNNTLADAAQFLSIMSYNSDPDRTGIRVLLDQASWNSDARMTLDIRNITFEQAVAQVATHAGADIIPLHQAVWLRAQPSSVPASTSSRSQPPSPIPMQKLDETGFAPLLDKDHFAFWKQAGKGTVVSEDGTLFPNGDKEAGAKCFWYSERMFGDFTLRVEFYIHNRQANSGVMIRFPDPGSDGSVPNMKGYEIDISPRATGDIWRWLGGSADDHLASTRPIKYDGWNLYEITVIGQKYTVKLNGQLVNEYEGRVGLRGYVGLQNCSPNGGVSFRNVRIKEMSASAPKTAIAEPDANLRTFTDRQGRRIRATLIRVQNDDVTLKREDGQEFSIKGSMLSDSDIGYLKPKGLVLPKAPAVVAAAPAMSKPPAAVVEPPKPAAVPAPSAPTTYGGMEFSPNWLPQTLSARRELLESYDFYCKAVIGNAPKGQEPVPDTIVGAIRWRMPIDEAIRTLPKGFNKLSERPMVHSCLPNNSLINCGFQYRSFQDRGQSFYEMFMLIDKQRRVVSVMFRDNGKDIQWFPKPDGIREPYYNMFSELTYNGSTTQEVPYQILGAGSGVTCIKTALRKKIIALPNMPNMPQLAPSGGGTKENVHWYLPAPFARSILDIVEVYRARGVIK